MRWLNGITDSMDMNLSKFWEILKFREAWCAVVHGVTKNWTRLRDRTIITKATKRQRLKSKKQIYHGVRTGSSFQTLGLMLSM